MELSKKLIGDDNLDNLLISANIIFKSLYLLNELGLNDKSLKIQDNILLELVEIEKLKELGCDDYVLDTYNRLVSKKKRSKIETGLCCVLVGIMIGFILKDCSPEQRKMIEQITLLISEKENKKERHRNGGEKSGKTRSEPRDKGYCIWKEKNLGNYKTDVACMTFKENYRKKYGKNPPAADSTITKVWFKHYKNSD